MLTPEYLVTVSDEVVKIFAEAEREIVDDIARRIVKMNYYTETAMWQTEKIKQFGGLQGDVKRILAKATGKSQKELSRIMKEAAEKGLSFDDAIYKAAGFTPAALAQSPALLAIVLQGRDSALALLNNYTKTTAQTATKAFNDTLDRALIQIINGTQSPTTAIKNAVNTIAKVGMEKVAYPSGVISSLENAVKRAILTGTNQTVAKLQEARADEMGTDLVEVTSHSGARPTHAEWQGGIYSLKGSTKGYRTLADACGYGSGDGLCGWNCYHNFYPYFLGLSSKSFSRDPSKDDGKDNNEQYEQQQKQRYYERQIRYAKKEVQALGSAIEVAKNEELAAAFKEDFDRASLKLSNRKGALDQFIRQTQRTKLPENENIAGWNQSIAMKAVWGARRAAN